MPACGDDLAIQVRARIEFAQDLRAVEAVYHKQCVSTFTSPLSIKCAGTTGVNIRNLNLDNDLAFQELCNWLQDEENQIRQYTMAELRTEMSRYLPDGVPAYSVNHLKKKLQERFQDQLTVSGMEGKMNVVTFSRSVTAILHETYTDTNTCDFDERLESIKNIGKSIRQDIHTEQKSNESYPPPCDINIETLESQIPYYLLKLITCIIHGPPEKTEVNERNRLVIISICHLIMQATQKQPFISPLLLSIGLFIHQNTRSRVHIDVLSSLGLSISYSNVLAFERSAAVCSSRGLPPGLDKISEGGGFTQWVADNFDYNEDTLTGHDTTHVMGIIACQNVLSEKCC